MYAPNQPLAFASDNLSYHTPRYYHTDALGSFRLMTKDDAAAWFTDGYQPFGQDNSATGSETYKFTGKPVSATTGLYYYYHRWYDPSIGRFISPDPKPCPLSECQKLNRYVYVTNRPTTLTDPDGEGAMCLTPDGIVSPCGILRDGSGNLPPGTKILGSNAQPTGSSSGPGASTWIDPSTEITSPTGILRDNFGNLPPGTRISVVRTPTGSVIMGTTTVANLNRQIDEDRAKLGTPSILQSPQSPGSASSSHDQCVSTPSRFELDAGLLLALAGAVEFILVASGAEEAFPPLILVPAVIVLAAGALALIGAGVGFTCGSG